MNLTSFASGIDFDAGEELPWDKPPKHHTFIASSIMPFATNMQVQVMTCAGEGADGQQGSDGEGEDDEEDKDERQAEAAPAGKGAHEAEGEAGETDGPEAVESEEAKRKRGWWPFFGSGSDSDSTANDDGDDDHGESESGSDQDPPAPSSSKHKSPSAAGRYIRIVLNDAVVPLTGINGCEADEDGKCAFDAFVDGMKEVISRVDFGKTCGARQEEGTVADGEGGADESDGQDSG